MATVAHSLQHVQSLEGHTDRVWHVSWSPDGAHARLVHTLGSSGGEQHANPPTFTQAPRWQAAAGIERFAYGNKAGLRAEAGAVQLC